MDTRGLLCPLPVIRTQDMVKTLAVGTFLDVLATDPGTLHDIPAWCRVHGHRLVETETVEVPGNQGAPGARYSRTVFEGDAVKREDTYTWAYDPPPAS